MPFKSSSFTGVFHKNLSSFSGTEMHNILRNSRDMNNIDMIETEENVPYMLKQETKEETPVRPPKVNIQQRDFSPVLFVKKYFNFWMLY